jgi:hypothetical protein
VIVNGNSRQTLRLQPGSIKELSAEDGANAQFRSLAGMDLALELARRGDVEISEKLKMYQSIQGRLEQVRQAIAQSGEVNAAEKSSPAVKFLQSQSDELKADITKFAAEKVAFPLKQTKP